jgi:hypothetical protein
MMKFTITTRVFLAVMVLSGVATGVLAMLFPDIAHGRFPSYSWPLIGAFLCELLLRPRIESGQMPPLAMEMRFFGVIGATLIAYGVEYWLLGMLAVDPAVQ